MGGICRIDDIFSRSRQDSFSAPGLSIRLSLIGSPQLLAFLASNLFIPSFKSSCNRLTGRYKYYSVAFVQLISRRIKYFIIQFCKVFLHPTGMSPGGKIKSGVLATMDLKSS